jgi:prepilin-type N-terminal cleavage/methylation domain-containing protein
MVKRVIFLNERGFTFTEFLISMVILGVGLLALAVLFDRVIGENAHSKQITTATAIAEDKMEKMKRTSFDSINNEAAQPVAGNTAYSIETAFANGPVMDTTTAPATVVTKTIMVTVSWKSGTKKVTLSSIVCK